MDLLRQKDLRHEHTFGIHATAGFFAGIDREEELLSLLESLKPEQYPLLILGGGSNVLFTHDFHGTVIRMNTKGMEVLDEQDDSVILRVSAGEIWDEVVEYCVEKGWGGIENLSLIPGRMGAAPIQNIGAYGVELKEVLMELETVHLKTRQSRTFTREDCRFGYRESIFRTTLSGQYVILRVTLKLSKKPQLSLDYGSIRSELDRKGITVPTIREIREAVCGIRRNKIPDPSVTGNAGSFFKNPVIRSDQFEQLRKQYPAIISYPDPNGIKLAAAWLIEQCGWKGRRSGDAGVHPGQPLVLVNYGKATGQEILDLAALIRQSVLSRFGILLEPEVIIL